MNLDKFKPLGNNHLIRFTDVPEKTEGGLFLPDSMRENYCEAEVLASGPGEPRSTMLGKRMLRWCLWVHPGSTVLIQKHFFTPLERGGKIGIVKEDDILGVVEYDDKFLPLNDWVKITPNDWEDETSGGITIAIFVTVSPS